jgi:hypothetical protein
MRQFMRLRIERMQLTHQFDGQRAEHHELKRRGESWSFAAFGKISSIWRRQ